MAESAERIIHDTMAGLAQKMLAEYGVRIDQVGFKWAENPEIDSELPAFVLNSVSIATTTV